MFDVSDLNYVFTNGCFDISIYLFFAKLLNLFFSYIPSFYIGCVLICFDHTRKILSKANEASTVKVFEAYLKISRRKL